jgi:hypothetical protein
MQGESRRELHLELMNGSGIQPKFALEYDKERLKVNEGIDSVH